MIRKMVVNSYHITSIFFYHASQRELIARVNRRHCCHQLSLFKRVLLEGHAPILPILVEPQRALNHIQRHSDNIPCRQLRAIIRSSRVAIMSGLPIVYRPPFIGITKRAFKIVNIGSADSYLDQLSFIDEDFEIVSSPFGKNLGS